MDRGSLNAIGFLTFMSLGGTLAALFASGPAVPAMPQPNGWRVLEPVTYENLSVFPVVTAKGADTSGFVTLDEALASGDAMVSERGGDIIRRTRDGRPMPIQEGGASVNQLVLINRGSKLLMLLAGELISGGKQDRVIAKDRIVAPGAEPLPLDVFCVEHGRWSSGAQFASAKIMVHPSVREKAAVDQKQSEVWAAVQSGTTARSAGPGAGAPAAAPQISMDSIATAVATEAPTQSYKGIYQSRRVGASVENFAEELQRRFKRATEGLKGERVVGVIVAYGGEVAWADVFASPKLFEGYWPKLVRSYVVEALARPQTREQASINDAREFLRPLQGREQVDSEPGIYRWRQVSTGRYAEIELEALKPAPLVLHTLKIHRTGDPTALTK
jgi:hypothetical protein